MRSNTNKIHSKDLAAPSAGYGFGWLFHSPTYIRLVAMTLLNLTVQIVGVLNLYVFLQLSTVMQSHVIAHGLMLSMYAFAFIVALTIASVIVFYYGVNWLSHRIKTLLLYWIEIINSVLVLFSCYLYGFNSALMGVYIAIIPLLILIIFNKRSLARKLITFVVVSLLFWLTIVVFNLPTNPVFTSNMLSNKAAMDIYGYMLLGCVWVSLLLFLLVYDQLMVYRASRQRRLEYISQTDDVTGLLNRAHITAILQSSLLDIAHHAATKQVSVILADIDFFKRVNDKYGHAAGDQVLITVSKILRKIVQPYGYVSRYGGEEFLMVLPNISLAEATKLAETLRTFIANTLIVHGEDGCYVTASFGVVSTLAMDKAHHNKDKVFDTVDKCLYLAKNTGRNKVVNIDAL